MRASTTGDPGGARAGPLTVNAEHVALLVELMQDEGVSVQREVGWC
jgi:hypothetical protein